MEWSFGGTIRKSFFSVLGCIGAYVKWVVLIQGIHMESATKL